MPSAATPACRDPSFLSNVDHELVHQIMRLGSHPSVVLWGGNNEIEASLEWYEETRSNLALFAVDYDLLFQQTVGRLVQEVWPALMYNKLHRYTIKLHLMQCKFEKNVTSDL